MARLRPKWIDDQYDQLEQERKFRPHKLTKREFMKGMMNGKRNRVPEGSGTSDGDILDGEMAESPEKAPEGLSE